MAKQSKQSDSKQSSDGAGGLLEGLPTDELKDQARDFAAALGERAMAAAAGKVGGLADRLVDYAEGTGDGGSGSLVGHVLGSTVSGLKDKVTSTLGVNSGGNGDGGNGNGGKGGGKKTKITNIVEQIDVGVPVRVAYNQWTQFQDFPQFTKRVESVKQESDEKISWKAGIYFSHRQWESTIVEQIPDERIVWHSEGEKGHVDGTVTFHEIAPNLTKILLVLEYHAQGLFERVGNAFRVQRRRARLEFQHFDRHVMTQTILDQDIEGWRGEIRDSEVVRSHEEALEEEGEENEEGDEGEESEDSEDEYEDVGDEEDQDENDDEYEDEADEDEGDEDEDDEDEYEGEYEDEDEDEYEGEYEDEDEDEEAGEAGDGRGRGSARGRRRQPAMSR